MKTAAILFLICVSFTASAYTQGTAADYERAKGLRAKYEAAAIDIAAQRRGSGIVIASGIANYHAVRTSM